MNRRLLMMISVAVVVSLVAVFLFVFFFSPGGTGGGGNATEWRLVGYHVTPGDTSPVLTLRFSRELDPYTTIDVINMMNITVGTWVYPGFNTGDVANLTKITPPNLIGPYYVHVFWKNTLVLNTTISFSTPSLKCVHYSLISEAKDQTVYLTMVNLTLLENGSTPFYYNRVRWTLDAQGSSEKIPMDHFEVGNEKLYSLKIGRFLDKGQHTLVVHFDYFDFNTLTVVIIFTV